MKEQPQPIIKSLAVGRLVILTMAAFLSLAMPGHAEDEAIKNNIREIQQVLNDCGFNAGPSDGIWGNRTTKAAQAFAQAHGWATFNDQSLLMAQVDAKRVGDNTDPCPSEETTTQASDESEPAGEAGSVTEEAGSGEADQAEENETGGGANTSKEIEQFKRIVEGLIYDAGDNNYIEIQVFEDKVVEQVYVDGEKSEPDGTRLSRTQRCERCGQFIFSELERAYIQGSRDIGYNLHIDLIENATEYSPGLTGEYFNDYDHTESGAIALDEVARIYRENRTNPNPSTKCYEWVSLGTFHLGTWKNGNGRETSGLPANANDTKIWDDDELFKDYQAAREDCVFSANHAMDSAIDAMVLIGRQATDVDNEKKRIRSFYKANLDKCQSEFDRRFRKYQNKFCE